MTLVGVAHEQVLAESFVAVTDAFEAVEHFVENEFVES